MHEANRRVQGAFNSAIAWSSVKFSWLRSLWIFLRIRGYRSSSLVLFSKSPLILCFSFKGQRINRVLGMLLNMIWHCFPIWEVSFVSGSRWKRHLIWENMFLASWIWNHFELFKLVAIASSQLHFVGIYDFVLLLEVKRFGCDSFPRRCAYFSKTLTIMRSHFRWRITWNAHWIRGALSSWSFSLLEEIARNWYESESYFRLGFHLPCKRGSLNLILVLQQQLNALWHSYWS